MKYFKEFSDSKFSFTKAFLIADVIFCVTALTCSAFAFYFAELTDYYYDMITLSHDMCIILRSGAIILSAAAWLSSIIETRQ